MQPKPPPAATSPRAGVEGTYQHAQPLRIYVMYPGTVYSSLFCQFTIITCDMQTLLRVQEGMAVHGRIAPLRGHSDRRRRFIPDSGNMRERQDRTCQPALSSGEALLALRTVPAQQQWQGLSLTWGVQTVGSWLPQAIFLSPSRAGAASLFSQGFFLPFVFASH